jgi:putative methyltransferase (TIGR04325 family)
MSINERTLVWEGVYGAFSETGYSQDVFEEATWSEKLVMRAEAALAEARSGGLVTGAVTFDDALPVVAAMASASDGPLRILDFGGGLGASYIPLAAVLRRDRALRFVIVENKTICRLGASLFANDEAVAFQSTIPLSECFDIVHAGSSLHYVEDWRGVMRQLCNTGAEYLVFADLPAGQIETFVTTQWFHGRRIPVWFWNAAEFSACVEDLGFELILKAAYTGRYLEKGASLPTKHFDARYRLEHFAQLIFRRQSVSRKPRGAMNV